MPHSLPFYAMAVAAMLLATMAPGRAEEERVTFTHSFVPMPVRAGAAADHTAATDAASRFAATGVSALTAQQLAAPVAFSVAMKMRNEEEFQARIANGEQVPVAEVESKYLPLASDYGTVRRWLVGQGFTIKKDDGNRLGIFARGTAAQVQGSFAVTMRRVTVDGVVYTAAGNAPSLPAGVAGGVLGVHGLQPYLKAHRHSHLTPMGLTTQFSNAPPYTVAEIRKAYDAQTLAVSGTTLTGANQKIAIIIDTFPLNGDLTSFWSANGISQSLSNIEEINVPGGTLDATSGEETLDVEWSSSIAPGAKVRVYASDDLQFVDIDACLSQLVDDVSGVLPAPPAPQVRAAPTQPQIHALSMSLGLGEKYLGAGNDIFTHESNYFMLLANAGVSTFVSSGDAGSTPYSTGHDSTGPLQAEYESTDPNVTGVGGTALTINKSTGLRTKEVVWDDGTTSATGGGTSIQFARPLWQTGPGVPAGTQRLAPDVCLAAAASTAGYLLYNGANYYVSGTSWSAPTWAGFSALINQGRAVANALRPPLGLLNPRIYPLIGTGNFYDITSGTNAVNTASAGSANGIPNYTANSGYDQCTGIGSPDVAVLLATLLGPTITGLSPANGIAGTSVVITGTDFAKVTSVTFNGTAAASYVVNSATQITAVAPAGVSTGPVVVTSLLDQTLNPPTFTVNTPDLMVTKTHAGTFIQADAADIYTIIVSNAGTAATSGTVTVTDTLPPGLSATALTGTGWTAAANHLSATRADALAAGGSYPALTLTVSVSPTAAASVTNTATVSGGGETNTANDSASDPTAVTALTPTQSWRYQYFGTTANTGTAADTANPSGDGIDNLLKYALGLDPRVPTLTTATVDTSAGYLRLTVPKNANATDLNYAVQVTSDPANPASWTTDGTTTEQNTTTILTVHDNTPFGSVARRFIRLQVTRP